MDIEQLIVNVAIWLMCEALFQSTSCDILANYQEFIDRRSHSGKEKVEIVNYLHQPEYRYGIGFQ